MANSELRSSSGKSLVAFSLRMLLRPMLSEHCGYFIQPLFRFFRGKHRCWLPRIFKRNPPVFVA